TGQKRATRRPFSLVRRISPIFPSAHLTGTCILSDKDMPTVLTRQHASGNPEGLRWFARSSSEQFASHARTSDASGLMHCQHGSHKYSSIGIGLLNRRAAETDA